MRVLTVNSHQPYVYDMAGISGIELFVIDQLPGRERDQWDQAVRPLPENVCLLSLEQALNQRQDCDVFVGHNLTDLSALKELGLPTVLLIHSSLDRLLAVQESTYTRSEIHQVLTTYINVKQVQVAAVSAMKAASWGVTDCPIIPFFTDTNFFQGYEGTLPQGLRVASQLVEKGVALNLEFYTELIAGFDIKLVGRNPQLDTQPANSREELRQFYRSRRYYVHTASEGLEDGYNMASLEAMATGMPVVCNQHPSAPVIDGKNGFISSDLTYLRQKMHLLEDNLELARTLGTAARRYVVENHSREQFDQKWAETLDLAVKRYRPA